MPRAAVFRRPVSPPRRRRWWSSAATPAAARLTILRGNTQTAENAATTSLAVNKPTDLADGDVIWTAVSAAGAVTITKPSGSWVAAGEVSGGTVVTVGLYYLIVNDAAAEPASYTWTISASGRLSLASTAYHNVDLASPLDVAATTASSGTGVTSLDLPGQTTATNGSVLVAACGNDSAGTALTPPGTMAQVSQSTGTGKRLAVADETFTTAGATGTRTWTQGSSLAMAGILAALRPALQVISFPNAKDLAEGTGTRAFATVTTRPGDYLLVQVGVENAVAGESYPASGGGLTYTPGADSGTGGGASKARAIIVTAPDSVGGARTVTITPSNATRNWRARLTVVRTSLGPSGSGASDAAQTVSVARTGVSSGVAMTVVDWSVGAVGSPVWTPGGTTVASQQGTAATYVFGRWDDAGAAGTASHGISSPSYTTPSVAALELLAGIVSAGPSGAAIGQQRSSATTTAAKGGAGATQGQQRSIGQATIRKQAAGATAAQQRTSGTTTGVKGAANAATGQQHTSGTVTGGKGAVGPAAGQQHSSGVAVRGAPGAAGGATGQQRVSGTSTGIKASVAAVVGQQHTTGTVAVRKQAAAVSVGQQHTTGLAATTPPPPSGPAVGSQRVSGITAGRKGTTSTAAIGQARTAGTTSGVHRGVGVAAAAQHAAAVTAGIKGSQGTASVQQRTAGLAVFTTVPVPHWVEGAGGGSGQVEGSGGGTGQVEMALAGTGFVEGSGGI